MEVGREEDDEGGCYCYCSCSLRQEVKSDWGAGCGKVKGESIVHGSHAGSSRFMHKRVGCGYGFMIDGF